jgi:hypothetical protein
MEKKIITGDEPAGTPASIINANGNAEPWYGMSIRQYYAGLAMQGMLSNHLMIDQFGGYDIIADNAVKFADALIASLNKING